MSVNEWFNKVREGWCSQVREGSGNSIKMAEKYLEVSGMGEGGKGRVDGLGVKLKHNINSLSPQKVSTPLFS